ADCCDCARARHPPRDRRGHGAQGAVREAIVACVVPAGCVPEGRPLVCGGGAVSAAARRRSWTNTSMRLLLSPTTRSVAAELKATKLPSALIAGPYRLPFVSVLEESTLTRSVVPVCRSWTNTSMEPLVSPGTRLAASEAKATKRPSALIAGL